MSMHHHTCKASHVAWLMGVALIASMSVACRRETKATVAPRVNVANAVVVAAPAPTPVDVPPAVVTETPTTAAPANRARVSPNRRSPSFASRPTVRTVAVNAKAASPAQSTPVRKPAEASPPEGVNAPDPAERQLDLNPYGASASAAAPRAKTMGNDRPYGPSDRSLASVAR